MPLLIEQLTTTGWRDLAAPPPALTSNMLVGAASYHAPLSSHQSWTQILEPAVPAMTIRRSYESEATAIPTSWETSEARLDIGKRAAAWSIRPPIAAFISGTYDSRLRSLLRSIPDDGHPKFLIAWHEADSKVRRGEYSRQQFVEAFTRFADIVHEENVANTFTVPCFTGWLWHDPARAAGQPEQWWIPGAYDVLSVDYYNDAPAAMFAPVVAYARQHDVPWAVAETGWIDDPANPSLKASRITATATYCATTGSGGWPSAVFLAWFDSDVGFDPAQSAQAFTPTSSPESIAAAAAAAQTHFRDPRTMNLPR